jgi:hypothetical protein
MTKYLVATAVLTALTSAASAADIQAFPAKGGNGDFFIGIEGRIEAGDDAKFEKVLADNDVKRAVIWLNSPGGEMYAGLGIGRGVKRREFSTLVVDKSVCMSMCALIWVAGFNRYYEDKARIGFHSMALADPKTGKKLGASNGGNALVGSYLSSLGMTDKAIYYLTSAPPNDLLWMNTKLAATLDITITNFKTTQAPQPATTQTSTVANDPVVAKKSDRQSKFAHEAE